MLEKATSDKERFHDNIAQNFCVPSMSVSLGPFESCKKFKTIRRYPLTMSQCCNFMSIYLILEAVYAICDP
jgi:hypothetical protein